MTSQPPQCLNQIEIDRELQQLEGWRQNGDSLERQLKFADFSEAFGFICRVALLAEAQAHHPEWRNCWNSVDIRLSTHESGGITRRDTLLAAAIEQVLQSGN